MVPKKKILIRIGSLRHGGAEKVLVNLLKNINENHYEIDLLLNLYSGKYLPEIPSWINILHLNKGEMITTNRLQDMPIKIFRVLYQKLLKVFPQLLYSTILKGKKYDIEFAAIHGMRDEILNSPLKSSKKIIWIHNDLKETELHNYTNKEFQKFFGFDKIMVISEKIKSDFINLARNETEKNKIARIYNPLNTNEILEKANAAVTNYQFSKTLKTFVSVGTVFPQKGFDRLLKVHQQLLNDGFPHKILIIGNGYDFEKINALKDELGIAETVTLFGFTDNPYPYFKNSDFYILSSRYEGFPTVLFEAISLKMKMIATAVSGVSEMLEEGKLGLIVENSEEGIYHGMRQALERPESFEKYKSALLVYKIPFDLESSVKSIVKIIDDL